MSAAIRLLGVDLAWRDATPQRPANASGVCVLDADGRVLDAGWTFGVDETVAWVRAVAGRGPAHLFVDAPLLVENASGMRDCERAILRRFGRYKLGVNASNLALGWLAGVTLRERLAAHGWRYDDGADGPPRRGKWMAECYPYATLVAAREFGLPPRRPAYKRRPRAVATADWPAQRAAALDAIVADLSRLTGATGPGAVALDLAAHPCTADLLATQAPLGASAYKRREDLVDAVLCAWTAALWWHHGTDRCEVLGPATLTRDDAASAGSGGVATPRPWASVIVPIRPANDA